MSEFDKLHAELDAILAKAQPVDPEAEPEDRAPDATLEDEQQNEGQGEGDGEDMMKSFRVTLDDGREVEAYDATAMMKSFRAQTRSHAEALASVKADLTAAHRVIAKQTDMLKSIGDRLTEQADMLKALREQPAGRRSAATHAAPAAPAALKGEEVLAKALSAQAAGRLSALDVATIEARLNSGVPIRPEHLAAIQAA